MEDFQFYVIDDRYSVRSLMLVQTKDEVTALSLAGRMLENQHYRGIEVWRGDRKLFNVGEGDPRSA